jgi:hypothetical protein
MSRLACTVQFALAGFFLAQGSFFRQNFSAEEHISSRNISEKMIIFFFYSQVNYNLGHLHYEARE